MRLAFASASAVLLSRALAAQCASFDPHFETVAGLIADDVTSVEAFDDGSGRALFVGGSLSSADGLPVSNFARWDGAQWSPFFAPGSPGFVPANARPEALRAWDDGTGAKLYVGGFFSEVGGVQAKGIARWDGSSWSALGTGLSTVPCCSTTAYALLEHDDGSGEALFVGGAFTHAGGLPSKSIAKWDGSSWSALPSDADGPVFTLAEHDDGSGPALYLGGAFTNLNGVACKRVARWDGSSFSKLGAGLDSYVHRLVSFDDGSGPALYAQGVFGGSGGMPMSTLARWKNGQWSAVGNVEMSCADLEVYDDGQGPALYALGALANSSAFHRQVLKWSGSAWSEVAATSDLPLIARSVDLGNGAELYVGGRFDRVGDALCRGLVRFDGQTWRGVGSGAGRSGVVEALAVHSIGGVPALYADSGIGTTSYTGRDSVIRWNGTAWEAVGAMSENNVSSLQVHDDGSGPALYAGGAFPSRVVRFDGSALQPVGSGPGMGVVSLTSWQSPAGPRLVAGGAPVPFVGGVSVWDGATWTALGNTMNDQVTVVGTFRGELYAGGAFTAVGGVAASKIARWDGQQWAALGTGLDSVPWSMAVFDDGSGEALYVGGQFLHAGGSLARHIARWDGTQWSAVGAGFNESVSTMRVFDEGSGPKLYAGGVFTASGVTPVRKLARWDGANWIQVDATLNASVQALAVFDRANGESSLFLGGFFGTAGGASSHGVAEYLRTFPCAPATYCTAQTNSLGCVPAISASGTPSLASSTFAVAAASVVSNKTGLLFWGLAPSEIAFAGGLRCVHAPLVRTPRQPSGGNPPPADCSGAFAFAFDSSYMGAYGFSPGQRIYCQYWSRDPGAPGTTNTTDALSFLVAP